MPGVESLTSKILEDARLQAEEAIRKAEAEADSILSAAKLEADKKAESLLSAAAEEGREKARRIISAAELEARKTILGAKQKLLDEVFETAAMRLMSLPAGEYADILANMIVPLVKSEDTEIVLSKKDKNMIGGSLAEKVNSRLKALGVLGKVRISELNSGIDGGFILRMGSVEVNCSFAAIIRMLRDELEPEIVKVLFG